MPYLHRCVYCTSSDTFGQTYYDGGITVNDPLLVTRKEIYRSGIVTELGM